MASAFGHALAAFALSKAFNTPSSKMKFVGIGIICSIIPDADVIGFANNIPYESFWGHRGFTHSLVFAILLGITLSFLFYGKADRRSRFIVGLYFMLCAASHGILDAMTSGGLGVGFFLPFTETRYFFPWRPIQVSPIGIDSFLGEWGLRVLRSEFIWIGIPSLLWMGLVSYVKKPKSK
jgi:inner membrane protein